MLRPGGSLFHIFAFAAIASIAKPAPFGEAMFAAAATILLALIIGASGALGQWSKSVETRTFAPAVR